MNKFVHWEFCYIIIINKFILIIYCQLSHHLYCGPLTCAQILMNQDYRAVNITCLFLKNVLAQL